jgi:Phage integrase family
VRAGRCSDLGVREQHGHDGGPGQARPPWRPHAESGHGRGRDSSGPAAVVPAYPRLLTAALGIAADGHLVWAGGEHLTVQTYVRGEFGTPKSKRSARSVPLPSRVATELELLFQDSPYKRDDDLVFAHPETGRPIDRSKLLKRFKAALRRGDVRAVRFHDLRHTFGTRMAAQGMPMRVLQELMGHRGFETTLIYADYAPSEREAEWVEQAFRSPAVDTTDPTRAPALS